MDLSITMEKTRFGVEAFTYKDQENNISGVGFFSGIPFNPETWIPFRLSRDSAVTVTIYDIAGTPVRSISVGYLQAGGYVSQSRAIYWDGKTDTGERVASGTYFYTLRTEGYTSTQKMIVLK